MGMTEYEDEPVEGLPEHLPEGETMVWQGRPTAAAMGKRVFYIRHLTLYFGLLIAGHTVYRLMEGVSAAQVMGTLVWQAGLAATVLVLLTWLARAYAKSILYTLTSERLVIRSGVALPMMANIPGCWPSWATPRLNESPAAHWSGYRGLTWHRLSRATSATPERWSPNPLARPKSPSPAPQRPLPSSDRRYALR